MKYKIILIVACFITISLMSFKKPLQFEPIAVIELFTSQGCSSCPSADKLLSQTISDAKKSGRKIVALSFHVDYWNRLGWVDTFSDGKYSQRQREYAAIMQLQSVYTPQIIVNGITELVGSNQRKLDDAIQNALNIESTVAFKTLKTTIRSGKAISVKYELEGNFSGCKINFALVALKETTSIHRGENRGRILKNENVVRQFISVAAKSNGEISFEDAPLPTIDNLAIVAFLQRNDLNIVGAAMALLN